jgi:hypothetical protein
LCQHPDNTATTDTPQFHTTGNPQFHATDATQLHATDATQLSPPILELFRQ